VHLSNVIRNVKFIISIPITETFTTVFILVPAIPKVLLRQTYRPKLEKLQKNRLIKQKTKVVESVIILAVWCSGNALVSINAVALHRARLVLGWVTAFGQVNCLIM